MIIDELCLALVRGRAPKSFVEGVANLQVFNATDCFDFLMEQWDSFKGGSKGVPRRPPYEETWVEWNRNGLGIACLYTSIERVRADSSVVDNRLLMEMLDSCFPEKERRLVCTILIKKNGILVALEALVVVGGNDQLTDEIKTAVIPAHSPWVCLPKLTWEDWVATNGLPSASSDMISYPAMLLFGLLNCKNIITINNSQEPRKLKDIRQGVPERVIYKTLKLQLPRTVVGQGGGGPSLEEPCTRLHLCRGHFKNLQHERYKDKGWHWWPAHWRGSDEVGQVVKDYAVTA